MTTRQALHSCASSSSSTTSFKPPSITMVPASTTGSKNKSLQSAGAAGKTHFRQQSSILSRSSPCGACKFLRKKCSEICVFAPYFTSENGALGFAAVHKVFRASNASKLLLRIPATRRRDAAATLCYEAQARIANPVFGCVATVLNLQQQMASLQSELAVLKQLIRAAHLTKSVTIPPLSCFKLTVPVQDYRASTEHMGGASSVFYNTIASEVREI